MAPRSTGVDIHHMGGAVARVPEDGTAFPNRRAAYWVNYHGIWDSPDDDEDGRAWARGPYDALRPIAGAGEYVNSQGPARGMPTRPLWRWGHMVQRSSLACAT